MSAYKIFTRQINFNIKFLVKHSDSNDDDEGDDDDADADAAAAAAPEKQTSAGKPAKRKAPKQTLKTKKKKQ